MPPMPPSDNTPAPANSAKKPRDSFQKYDVSRMEENWRLGYQLAEQEALMMLRRLAVEDLQKKHDSEPMSSDTPEGLRMTKLHILYPIVSGLLPPGTRGLVFLSTVLGVSEPDPCEPDDFLAHRP